MWARLQGVGISVRADTALPWPLLLLHKTSQPALSPGLESVSAATCQIKQKGKNKKPCPSRLPPCVTIHPSLLALVPLPHRWWAVPVGRPITLHNMLLDSLMQPASLTSLVCHSLCYLSLPGQLIINLVYIFQTVMLYNYQVNSQKCGRSQGLWLPWTDELLWSMRPIFPLRCLLITHVIIAGMSVSRVSGSPSCGWSRSQPKGGKGNKLCISNNAVLYKSVCNFFLTLITLSDLYLVMSMWWEFYMLVSCLNKHRRRLFVQVTTLVLLA